MRECTFIFFPCGKTFKYILKDKNNPLSCGIFCTRFTVKLILDLWFWGFVLQLLQQQIWTELGVVHHLLPSGLCLRGGLWHKGSLSYHGQVAFHKTALTMLALGFQDWITPLKHIHIFKMLILRPSILCFVYY